MVDDHDIDYRTAYSMCMKIRKSMSGMLVQTLKGTIEIDESFIGGHRKLVAKTDKKGIGDKDIVLGMLQRNKWVRLFHLDDKGKETIRPLIKRTIVQGSVIHRDGNASYGDLEAAGFRSRLVKKKTDKEFSGEQQVNNNGIEGTWMRLKHWKIKGVHHSVSPKYLQLYLDEFSYKQRNRGKWCRKNIGRAIIEVIVGRRLPYEHREVKFLAKEIGDLPQKKLSARECRRRKSRQFRRKVDQAASPEVPGCA